MISVGLIKKIALKLINTFCLGNNQTWQDMSSQRAQSIIYTNTTGKPIIVSVTVVGNGSNPDQIRVGMKIDNGNYIMSNGYSSGGSIARITMTRVIPNNSTYLIGNVIGAGIESWEELR